MGGMMFLMRGSSMLALALLLTTLTSYGNSQIGGYYAKGGSDVVDEDVSLIQLLANPKAYDGKTIRIVGFLHLESEEDVLYLHSEDFRYGLTKNGIWIELPKDMTREQMGAVNDRYVVCTARFLAKMHGHNGMNSGEVANVTRLEAWSADRGNPLTPPIAVVPKAVPTRSYVVLDDAPKPVAELGVPLVAGSQIAFNLYYRQVGPNPVQLGGIVATAYLRGDDRISTEEELARLFESEVEAKQAGWSTSLVTYKHPTLGVSTSQFVTAGVQSQNLEPLNYTQEDLDALDKGTKIAFVMLNVPYEDLGVMHQFQLCLWLQTNGNWHYCSVYNKSD